MCVVGSCLTSRAFTLSLIQVVQAEQHDHSCAVLEAFGKIGSLYCTVVNAVTQKQGNKSTGSVVADQAAG